MEHFSRFRRLKKSAAPVAASESQGDVPADPTAASQSSAHDPALVQTPAVAAGQAPVDPSSNTGTAPADARGDDTQVPSSSFTFHKASSNAPAPSPQTQQPQQEQKQMRSSRSPFRNLLRSSTKRSRESPPSAAAVPALPRSPTAGLTNQFQSISLPSNGGSHSPPKPGQLLGGTSEHSVPVEQPAAAADKPSMPAFLQLSPHEIELRFQDLIWLERNRIQSSLVNPGGPWVRVTGSHLKKLDRYMNIQPWDHNRVRLKVPEGHVDYINASPIVLTTTAPSHVSRPPDRYIAMQGPKQNSIDHVWRMIYEQLRSPAVIVMLTETHEGSMEKCYPYYPLSPDDPPIVVNEKDEFGDGFHASVRCDAIEETNLGDAVELRRIVLRVHRKALPVAKNGAGGPSTGKAAVGADASATNGSSAESSTAAAGDDSTKTAASLDDFEDERIVYHFLFKKWPDFGVPEKQDVDSFLGLMHLSAERNADADNPRIVHCSAGVGRSGTFIALEHLLRELDAGVLESYDGSASGDTAEDKDMDAADGPSSQPQRGRQGMQQVRQAIPAAAGGDAAVAADNASAVSDDSTAIPAEADDLIFTTVNQLREQRRMMVQADTQYQFIYHVLRRLWQEKYGVDGTDSTGAEQSRADEGPDDPDGLEPAAKRLEVDPFVEKK